MLHHVWEDADHEIQEELAFDVLEDIVLDVLEPFGTVWLDSVSDMGHESLEYEDRTVFDTFPHVPSPCPSKKLIVR